MENKDKNIAGVVLSGGKNSRYFGKNKSLLKIEKQTFYDKIVNVLKNNFDDLIVISNSPESLPKDNIPKHKDIIKDIGPIGGIHSALSNAEDVIAVFIVAADMPFINENIIQQMTNFYTNHDIDILIPKIDENIEPMFAIYSTSILDKLNEYLNTTKVYSIRSFFKHVNTKYFEIEAIPDNIKAFININCQEDYEKYVNNVAT